MYKVIKFGAKWCPPCQTLKPIFERVNKAFTNKVEFEVVDIDESPELATQFKVSAVPTILLMKDDKVEDQIVGLCPEAALVSKIKELLAK